jgi:hypothetical protein
MSEIDKPRRVFTDGGLISYAVSGRQRNDESAMNRRQRARRHD